MKNRVMAAKNAKARRCASEDARNRAKDHMAHEEMSASRAFHLYHHVKTGIDDPDVIELIDLLG